VALALVKVAKQAAGRGAWLVVLDAITALLLHTDPASALSAAGGSWTLLSHIGVAAVSASGAVTASSLGLVCSIVVSVLRILPHASATTPSDTVSETLADWAAALLGRIDASLAEGSVPSTLHCAAGLFEWRLSRPSYHGRRP
jgi:ABC-type transport system involved in cytochrome c biogenesis permease component